MVRALLVGWELVIRNSGIHVRPGSSIGSVSFMQNRLYVLPMGLYKPETCF